MSDLIGLERKGRATQGTIKEFAKWALTENVYEKYRPSKIRELYHEKTNVYLSEVCIRRQQKRWVLIDDEIYDVNKPYTFPEK